MFDSEGSCDTEDWSNDLMIINELMIAEINGILTDIQIENSYFKL